MIIHDRKAGLIMKYRNNDITEEESKELGHWIARVKNEVRNLFTGKEELTLNISKVNVHNQISEGTRRFLFWPDSAIYSLIDIKLWVKHKRNNNIQ